MIKKSRRISVTAIACCAFICIAVTIFFYYTGVYSQPAGPMLRYGDVGIDWYGMAVISVVLVALLIALIVAK